MTTPAANTTSPSTTNLLHPTSDGVPFGVRVSMASTNLYLPSSLIFGGIPLRSGTSSMRKSSVSLYASDLRARRSLVVFTGAKRDRGMTTAVAPSKHPIAAPIAVSSCRTFVDFLSRGSTVLPLVITGSGSMPPCFSNWALSAGRSTQRLFVLKNLYLPTFWNSFSSSSGHWADSRRRRPPVLASLARWPPFLSASVRVAASIMKGAFDWAK
mmetsp:Transcript_20084/g.45755  ORF Transcript_20084/g.45755 Transcript_20084/m.45755 type:complete len:212 (-) Transcript_20084:55-690(-)